MGFPDNHGVSPISDNLSCSASSLKQRRRATTDLNAGKISPSFAPPSEAGFQQKLAIWAKWHWLGQMFVEIPQFGAAWSHFGEPARHRPPKLHSEFPAIPQKTARSVPDKQQGDEAVVGLGYRRGSAESAFLNPSEHETNEADFDKFAFHCPRLLFKVRKARSRCQSLLHWRCQSPARLVPARGGQS